MKLADFRRLRKCMALTASDNDAEALAALRQAAKILTANGLTWDNVFDRTVRVTTEIEEAPVDTPRTDDFADKIESALQKVLDNTRAGDFRDFILSLEAQWRDKRYLSKPQRDALFKAAARR